MGFTCCINNSLICDSSITFSKSHITVTNPFSSNSQINWFTIVSIPGSIYTETDLVLPIFLINLKIEAFFK
uniref:Uncharacterized protein n=1 Tax=viral metagenome TaxID=1070528 RepID=A0A6C0D8G9_9ZZZZ